MASEYLKWKYKDVKPDQPPQYSKEVLRRTWWEYNFKWVLLGLAAAIVFLLFILDIFFRTRPDYQIAFVCRTAVPDEVVNSLELQLAQLGEDINGDGQVVVSVNTYELDFDGQGRDGQSAADMNFASGAATRLAGDISAGNVYLILLDDPEGFQRRMGALAFLDGGEPPMDGESYGAERWREMVYQWTDCPALGDMELGVYHPYAGAEETEETCQTFLHNMFVGHRTVYDDALTEHFTGDEELWRKLTAGANS